MMTIVLPTEFIIKTAMPSPFPGMDPWLEAADIWPDFHDSFASEIRAQLNASLPPPYYARLEMRQEVGVVDDESGEAYRHQVIPDVSIAEVRRSPGVGSSVAATAAPRTEISEFLEVTVPDEEGRHLSVQVRDSSRRHRLVTFIEIVSPSNKTAGIGRESYLEKRDEVLGSSASLIEIDLLRGGRRVLPSIRLKRRLARLDPPTDYLVLINRAWSRGNGAGKWHLFPISVRQTLPVIPVPLRAGEPEISLDLQHVFNRAYDTGPYQRGALDYRSPPHPRLNSADYEWARERLAAK
ncbi:MAG TPA: DUF4058 family protein [Pirellulales bacterium]|nr:DUF4058 family protein [Pirellulales bacterium]